ncbi:MAG TPA: glycosyltransferase family 4 protein [Candidatus Kryptonia bacterium]|nr:glycosyltransferase family 4 protein [Candidatus Kryptonia bacterium]
MRVLIDAIAMRGGMVQYANELATALAREHEVTVVTAATNVVLPNARVLGLEFSRGAIRGLGPAYRRLREYIREWRPDVVHVTAVNIRNLVLNRAFGRTPMVVTVHDVQLHPGDETLANRLATWHHNRAGEFWIVHGAHSRRLLAAAGKPADRIAVIPFGPLQPTINDVGPEPSTPTLLFFGRIRAYKGLDVLLRAARIVAQHIPELQVIVAGSGPLAPYRSLISGLRCEVINRFVPDEEIRGLFARSTVLVCPHVEASQSGVVPLAYGYGRALVASAVGDLPDAITDGQSGVLVPPGDIVVLAATLRSVLGDPSLRRRLRAGGQRMLQTKLSWTAVAAATSEVYRAVQRGKLLRLPRPQANVHRGDSGQAMSQEQLQRARQQP